MTTFSIIIPTFDHGKLIATAIESVLAQQEQSWELCVIGDGSPSATEKLLRAYERQDSRIRFFPKPKGPRNGEIYRDEIIRQHTSGKYICYLSDDDLYFPDHLTFLRQQFERRYNFVSTFGVSVTPKQEFYFYSVDLNDPYYVELLLGGENRVPLSNGAHTRRLYNQLPFGWRTTPKGIPTDLYMWQQILSSPATKPTTVFVPTVLHFASPERKDVTQTVRLKELTRWLKRITADPTALRSAMGTALFFQVAAMESRGSQNLPDMKKPDKPPPEREILKQIYDSKIGWIVRWYFSAKEKLQKGRLQP